jgi:hypothetical protein
MLRIAVKVLISSLILVSVSELGKRFSFFAAILASLPLTSILALTWLYADTRDLGKVAELSVSIFWLVLPSVLFFIALPGFLKGGFKFPSALALSCVVMTLGYFAYVWILKKFGIAFI